MITVSDTFAPADYTEGSELDMLIKAIIDKTVANEILENYHFSCKESQKNSELGDEKRHRQNMILSLNSSKSFATTREVIRNLQQITSWDEDEIELLLETGLNNSQVRNILKDLDVKTFYSSILEKLENKSELALNIEKLINS